MATRTAQERTVETTINQARVQEFAGQLLETYALRMVGLMIELAHRTGLLEALADGPGTSQRLADRAGIDERCVREILGALVASKIVDHDPAGWTYTLPAEHAVCLTGPGSLNLAPLSQLITLLAKHVEGVERTTREGGGVPYGAFRPQVLLGDQHTPWSEVAIRTTFPPSLAGVPALSTLAGFTQAGLPIGVQIVGAAGQDETCLRVGQAIDMTNDPAAKIPRIVAGPDFTDRTARATCDQ